MAEADIDNGHCISPVNFQGKIHNNHLYGFHSSSCEFLRERGEVSKNDKAGNDVHRSIQSLLLCLFVFCPFEKFFCIFGPAQ